MFCFGSSIGLPNYDRLSHHKKIHLIESVRNSIWKIKGSKLVLPSMMKRKSGHIANVSRFVISFCWLRCLFTSPLWCMVLFSLAGIVATPLRSAYCGAKSGLMGYFNAVRLEQFAHDTDVVVSEKVLLGFDCFDRIGVNHRSLVSPRHTLNFLFSRSQIYAPELLKHRSV
jgi:hypothetical protein